MDTIFIPKFNLTIHPITLDDLPAVLAVYKQCEDFLELGPVSTASMEMVLKDIQISESTGGIFCGIFASENEMIGVIDYIPADYQCDPHVAFLELLMISAPYRNQGFGEAIVAAFENEIRKNPEVMTILSGVQVNNPRAVRFWQRNGYRIVSGPELMPDQTVTYGLRKDFKAQA